jgi:glycosyltransferase involved in cell wall biosynthesis
VQTNLVAIRDRLRQLGHTAAVINITRFRKAGADEVFYPETPLETARLIRRLPAEIIHLHFGGNLTNRLLALCLYCTFLPHRKTVLTFHSGGYPSSPKGRDTTRNSFAGFTLRRVDALIAVNQEIGAFFRQCGATTARVHVISPHATLTATNMAADLPEPIQSFMRSHSPVLLSVGGLEPEYDLPLQITALGRIRQHHPNAGIVMIGGGSRESELRSLIAAQPWAEHLLLPGDVPHAITLRAIHECSVFLRTTLYDGDSISVREALDLGTPVIATETVLRPPGCHLIPAGQIDPLVHAVNEAITSGNRAPESAPSPDHRSSDLQNLDDVIQLYGQLLDHRTA